MPRKTRKEKIAATIHKRKEKPVVLSPVTEKKSDLVLENKRTTSPSHTPGSAKKSPFASDDKTKEYFMTDLRKSLIVVFLILFIEVALYILNLSGMLTIVNF